MLDVTEFISSWVSCSKDIWERWFREMDDGEHEFSEVERALFSALVLSKINVPERPSHADPYELLDAVYKEDIDDVRSVCKQQKAGNIYCSSRAVKFAKGTSMSIKWIDPLGTMLDGEAYVELWINAQEYILEPLDSLKLMFRS